MVDYVVEAIDPVALNCGEPLQSMDWMSPFVWRDPAGFKMMMRAVPNPLRPDDSTGFIYCGDSDDGLQFRMNDSPAISPGPENADAAGVEDPTVVADADGLTVYYTGVEEGRTQGSLLKARGRDFDHLAKQEVMLKAPDGQGNIKEATLAAASDGSWRLFYEFAHDNASRIGVATSGSIDGEWTPVAEPFSIRDDRWDNWHLSTGPIVTLPGRDPVMFYNGATADARWRIGWISFDPDYRAVRDRCVEPMLVPPPAPDRSAPDIAFAASALVTGPDMVDLYYSLEDRTLSRCTIRAYG